LKYAGSCEGFTEGEIRVDGAIVELWASSGGDALQRVGSATRQPDDTFTLQVPEAGFVMIGTVHPETVSGSGSFQFAGSNCPFTFSGSRVAEANATTTTTTAQEEATEELDPTGTGPLSDAEVRWVLERQGLDATQIKGFFASVRRTSMAFNSDDASYNRVVAIASLVTQFTRIRDDSGERQFPILHTLLLRRPDSDPCCGPLVHLARALRGEDPEVQSAFHRAVRLAITMELP